MCSRVLIASLALLLGCSDFECPDGEPRVDGMCPPAGTGSFDLEPVSKRIPLACTNSLPLPVDDVAWSLLEWELTVDPGRLPSGESFAADFKAFAGFSEYFLNGAQTYLGNQMRRVNFVELRATVLIRRGAEDSDPVPLTLGPTSIPWTCRYDDRGNAVFAGRDFPSCLPENTDLDDGSNEDCIGLGGKPSTDNPCGQFRDVPISLDCDPGGVCDRLGKRWPVWESAKDLCDRDGFCVTGAVEVELVGEMDGFIASDFGRVVFGFDDLHTGAELDQTNGPNHGTWELPPAVFDEEPGPNSLRVMAGDTRVAMECTMAISSWSVFAKETPEERPMPAPDHLLISFPIQEP